MKPVPDADPNKTYPPDAVFYVVDSDGKPSNTKLYVHQAWPPKARLFITEPEKK